MTELSISHEVAIPLTFRDKLLEADFRELLAVMDRLEAKGWPKVAEERLQLASHFCEWTRKLAARAYHRISRSEEQQIIGAFARISQSLCSMAAVTEGKNGEAILRIGKRISDRLLKGAAGPASPG